MLQNLRRVPEDVAKPREGSAVWFHRPGATQKSAPEWSVRGSRASGLQIPSWEDCSDPCPWGKVPAGTHHQGEERSWDLMSETRPQGSHLVKKEGFQGQPK